MTERQIIHTPVEGAIAHLEAANGGAKIARITTLTAPKMLKKHRETGEPNPFLPGGVVRRATRIVSLGVNYEAAVNRQRAIEATDEQLADLNNFVAEQLWRGKGRRVEGHNMLAQHVDTGMLYLCYRPHQNKETGLPDTLADEWVAVSTGEPLNHDDLRSYLPVPSSAPKQEVDRPVPWRCLHIENLREVVYGEHILRMPPGPIVAEDGRLLQLTL